MPRPAAEPARLRQASPYSEGQHSSRADAVIRPPTGSPPRKRRGLSAIGDTRDASRLSAVRTTVVRATRFDSVPDDLATTMGAHRCECMDGALEAVERARALRGDHLKRLVVIVSADITFRHQVISMADAIYFWNQSSCIAPQIVSSAMTQYAPRRRRRSSCAIAFAVNANEQRGDHARGGRRFWGGV